MSTAFERTLERVQKGETITVSVLTEYRSWRKYYDYASKEERRQISEARHQFHYNKPGVPLTLKQARETEDIRLKMPLPRKMKMQKYCRDQGISMSRYINSVVAADQAQR